MSIGYNFNKQVNSDKLTKEILVEELPLLFINTLGDTVSVVMEEELTNEEIDVLSDIIINHTTTDLEVIIKNKILAAMDFGRNLMAQYGAQNVLAGYNVTQIQTIMEATEKVQAALNTGSLYVALNEIENIEPDGVLITQATLDNFRHKIQDYLEIPRT